MNQMTKLKVKLLFFPLFFVGILHGADIPLADYKVDTLFFKPWNSSNGLICEGPPRSFPHTFSVDGNGSVWIPDGSSGHLIKRFSPDGDLLQTITNLGSPNILDCGVDQSNNLYVLSGDITIRLGCHLQKFVSGQKSWTYKNLIYVSPLFTASLSGHQFVYERFDDGNGAVKVIDKDGNVSGILPAGFFSWPSPRKFVAFRSFEKQIGLKTMELISFTNFQLMPEEKALKRSKLSIIHRTTLGMRDMEKYYARQWASTNALVEIPKIVDSIISPLGMDAYGSFFGLFRTPLSDRYYVLRVNDQGNAVRIPIEPISLVANRSICIDRYGQVYEMVFEKLGMKVIRISPVK